MQSWSLENFSCSIEYQQSNNDVARLENEHVASWFLTVFEHPWLPISSVVTFWKLVSNSFWTSLIAYLICSKILEASRKTTEKCTCSCDLQKRRTLPQVLAGNLGLSIPCRTRAMERPVRWCSSPYTCTNWRMSPWSWTSDWESGWNERESNFMYWL